VIKTTAPVSSHLPDAARARNAQFNLQFGSVVTAPRVGQGFSLRTAARAGLRPALVPEPANLRIEVIDRSIRPVVRHARIDNDLVDELCVVTQHGDDVKSKYRPLRTNV